MRALAVKVCQDRTTPYAVSLTNCPHCLSERGEVRDADPYRGENTMPKISRNGGATIRGEHGPELVAVPDDAPAVADADLLTEGGETPSPGSSSKTSTPKPPATPAKSSKRHHKPAQTTASRSKRGQTGASTVPSTDGGQTADGSAIAD